MARNVKPTAATNSSGSWMSRCSRLAERLGDAVRTEAVVATIDWVDRRAMVTTAGDRNFWMGCV